MSQDTSERMDGSVEVSLSISRTLFKQAEMLAQQLHISQATLFERALEHFIANNQNVNLPEQNSEHTGHLEQAQPTANQPLPSSSHNPVAMRHGEERKRINQGDIYWVTLHNLHEHEPAIPHPYVIVQDNVLNHSRIHTVVACALTSNRSRTSDTPGNILLEPGEANLPKQSVVEVSKITTIEKAQLGEYIGSLTIERVHQILAGIRFLQNAYFNR